jgi:hypothetical protein
MGDYWTNAVRHPEDIGVGHIRRTISFDSAGAATGIPIGALEAGAVPLETMVSILTAFNGTTPLFTVGTLASAAGLMTTAVSIPGTPGLKSSIVGVLAGIPLDVNTVIYAFSAPTSGTATTGKAIVMVRFVNKREIEGIPFPAN